MTRIMVAPNGARRGKADHPALPITLPEIAAEACACQQAGAEALHLHVRDADGRHSLDPGLYAEAIAAVTQAAPGMAVQITTEAAGMYTPEDQRACLQAVRPAWASVAVREMASAPAIAARFYAEAAEAGTRLQHILYGPDCLTQLMRWRRDGTLPGPAAPEVIGVLGAYAPPRAATLREADRFLSHPDSPACRWAFCGFGPQEHRSLTRAAPRAEWLRVGFENNLHRPSGELWPDNAASVRALCAALTPVPEPVP